MANQPVHTNVPNIGSMVGVTRPLPASQDLVDGFQARLRDAARRQGEVAKARQQLLLQREKVRASAQTIREQRLIAGDSEATYMNTLRQWANKGDRQLSATTQAYARVEDERNALGVLEADHIEAERALTGAEWTFMELEDDFYQIDLQEILEQHILITQLQRRASVGALPSAPPPPPPPPKVELTSFPSVTFPNTTLPPCAPPRDLDIRTIHPPPPEHFDKESYQISMTELSKTRTEFKGLRQEQAQRLGELDMDISVEDVERYDDPLSSDFAAIYFLVLDKLIELEVKVLLCKGGCLQREVRLSVERCSKIESMVPMSQLKEGVVRCLPERTSVEPKIEEWLWGGFEDILVHRLLYLNTVAAYGPQNIDFDSIEDWAATRWHLSSEDYDTHDEDDHVTTINHSIENSASLDSEKPKSVHEATVQQSGPSPTTQKPRSLTSVPEHIGLGNVRPDASLSSPNKLKSTSVEDAPSVQGPVVPPEAIQPGLKPHSPPRKDSHQGSEASDCQRPVSDEDKGGSSSLMPSVDPSGIQFVPSDRTTDEVPSILITGPTAADDIDKEVFNGEHSPDRRSDLISGGPVTPIVDPDSPVYCSGTYTQIHRIRVDETPIPRPASVRSHRKEPHGLLHRLFSRGHKRSLSTSAIFSTSYTDSIVSTLPLQI